MQKTITYKIDTIPSTAEIIEVYDSSGINRPTKDKARIEKMYQHSNLVVTAWDGDLLVGVSRSLTDFCYCCYLSDLAVKKAYQKQGIGQQLITLTKEKIGTDTVLLLVTAPSAKEYYPKIGFKKLDNGFLIPREPW